MTIHRVRRNHNKRCLFSLGGEKIVYIGSANNSNQPYRNREIMTRIVDERVYDQLLDDHISITLSPGKKKPSRTTVLTEIDETPKRRCALSSRRSKSLLTTAVAARLNFNNDELNAEDEGEVSPPSRSVQLATMGFTDSPIKHKLARLASDVPVTVLVDGSTLLSKEGKRHLDELAQSGAHVFVFNPYGDKGGKLKDIFHSKLFIRQAVSESKNLVSVLTKNLTLDRGDSDSAVLFPGNKRFVQVAQEYIAKELTVSVSYAEINWDLVPATKSIKKRKLTTSKNNRRIKKRKTLRYKGNVFAVNVLR